MNTTIECDENNDNFRNVTANVFGNHCFFNIYEQNFKFDSRFLGFNIRSIL
jgi:hypothetical protein